MLKSNIVKWSGTNTPLEPLYIYGERAIYDSLVFITQEKNMRATIRLNVSTQYLTRISLWVLGMCLTVASNIILICILLFILYLVNEASVKF